MARYEHLPIYKESMDLAILVENSILKFSKSFKYTLGNELRTRVIRLLSLVVRANSSHEKKIILEEIRIVLEELTQILLLAKEVKALPSFGMFKDLMLKIENVSKQNEGWLKSQKSKSNSQNS